MKRAKLHDRNGQPIDHPEILVREAAGALVARDTRVSLGERVFVLDGLTDNGDRCFREVDVQYLCGDEHPDALHPPR